MPGRVYEMPFSFAADELLALDFGESVSHPRAFVCVIADVAIVWTFKFFPDGHRDRGVFQFVVGVGVPCENMMTEGSLDFRLGIQVSGEDGVFPGMDPKGFYKPEPGQSPGQGLAFRFSDPTVTKPTLTPGRTHSGRFLVYMDTAALSPPTLAQANIAAVEKVDYGPIVREMYEAALAGDESFGDTKIVCRDGVLRATGNILRIQSEYFAKLVDFNKRVGKSELVVDFSAYGGASVRALLSLIHTFALPPLDPTDIPELLELAAQVAPKGLPLLKATAEKCLLLGAQTWDAAALGEMVKLGLAHELPLLLNVAQTRLARNLLHNHHALGESLPTQVWNFVADINENSVDGIAFNMNPDPAPVPVPTTRSYAKKCILM